MAAPEEMVSRAMVRASPMWSARPAQARAAAAFSRVMSAFGPVSFPERMFSRMVAFAFASPPFSSSTVHFLIPKSSGVISSSWRSW